MNTIEIPWTLATAGLVGLGGLAFLMGAVLSAVAELLALLRAHRDWAGSDARSSGSPAMRPGLRRPQAGHVVTTVLAWPAGSDAIAQRSERERPEPRAAA